MIDENKHKKSEIMNNMEEINLKNNKFIDYIKNLDKYKRISNKMIDEIFENVRKNIDNIQPTFENELFNENINDKINNENNNKYIEKFQNFDENEKNSNKIIDEIFQTVRDNKNNIQLTSENNEYEIMEEKAEVKQDKFTDNITNLDNNEKLSNQIISEIFQTVRENKDNIQLTTENEIFNDNK